MKLKYAIVPYPIPENILKSGMIAQTQISTVTNNKKDKCIVSYQPSYNSIFSEYSNFDTAEELLSFKSNNPKEWDVDYVDLQETYISRTPAFSDKYIIVNGDKKSLFKRVHGVNINIPAGQTGFIEFTVPYSSCKFTGVTLFGVDLKDRLDLFILDTENNDYSGAPGSNYVLNQFGFNVQMPSSGEYQSESNYDADIFQGMVISCAYKNNGTSTKFIAMNLGLHEVK